MKDPRGGGGGRSISKTACGLGAGVDFVRRRGVFDKLSASDMPPSGFVMTSPPKRPNSGSGVPRPSEGGRCILSSSFVRGGGESDRSGGPSRLSP